MRRRITADYSDTVRTKPAKGHKANPFNGIRVSATSVFSETFGPDVASRTVKVTVGLVA